MKNKLLGLLLIAMISSQSAFGMNYIKNNPKISAGIFLLLFPVLGYMSKSAPETKEKIEGKLDKWSSMLVELDPTEIFFKSYKKNFKKTYGIFCTVLDNTWKNKEKIVLGGLGLYTIYKNEDLREKIVTEFNKNPILTTTAALVGGGYVVDSVVDNLH